MYEAIKCIVLEQNRKSYQLIQIYKYNIYQRLLFFDSY